MEAMRIISTDSPYVVFIIPNKEHELNNADWQLSHSLCVHECEFPSTLRPSLPLDLGKV